MNVLEPYFHDQVLYALGWAVLHSLWQALMVAFFLRAILYLLRNNSARLRYLVSYAAMVLILVVSVCTYYALLTSSEEVASDVLTVSGRYDVAEGIESWRDNVFNFFDTHLQLIVMGWLLGVVLLSVRMAVGLIAVQRLKYHNTIEPDATWRRCLNELRIKIGVRREVVLLESLVARVPMVIGWFKPVILFPLGAVNRLSFEEVEAVLAHELAHIRRHDYLLNLLQTLIEILYYFNPAVWWISRLVRLEREHSADDFAVEVCGDSLLYARALYKLQELQVTAPLLAMPLMTKDYQLLNRIFRILKPSSNKTDLMGRLSAISILMAAILLFSMNTKNTALAEEALLFAAPPMFGDKPTSWEAPLLDTIPNDEKREDFKHYRQRNGNEEIEIEMHNGEITTFKINGNVVPKSEYPKHEELIQKLLEEAPVPPIPPTPPTPPTTSDVQVPEAPPTPPSYSLEEECNLNSFGKQHQKIVTKKTGKDETTILVETSPGEQPIEIIVKEGKKGSVIINGQEIKGMKKGDQTIIMNDVQRHAHRAPYSFAHPPATEFYGLFRHPQEFEFNFEFDPKNLEKLELEEWMREYFNHLEEEREGSWKELQREMERVEEFMRERAEQYFNNDAEQKLMDAERLEELARRQQEYAEQLRKRIEEEQLRLEKQLQLLNLEKNKPKPSVL